MIFFRKKMKVGSFIEIKSGIIEPDFKKFSMDGWSGIVTAIEDSDKEGVKLISIDWDVETLKNIPEEYFTRLLKGGYAIDEMRMYDTELNHLDLSKQEIKKRMEGANELLQKFETIYDEDSQQFLEILGSDDIGVHDESLAIYRTYLSEHLKTPFKLTGKEVFPWEERAFFTGGRVSRDKASSNDTFKFIKILDHNDGSDLYVKAKRVSDNAIFELPLSYLGSTAKKSKNNKLLSSFSFWIANYQ